MWFSSIRKRTGHPFLSLKTKAKEAAKKAIRSLGRETSHVLSLLKLKAMCPPKGNQNLIFREVRELLLKTEILSEDTYLSGKPKKKTQKEKKKTQFCRGGESVWGGVLGTAKGQSPVGGWGARTREHTKNQKKKKKTKNHTQEKKKQNTKKKKQQNPQKKKKPTTTNTKKKKNPKKQPIYSTR